ncbi:UDP-glycosyltransferase 1 [Linum perenne]
MVELDRLILTLRPSLSIPIIHATSPYQSTITTPYTTSVSAATPSITFHNLPPPPPATVASIHHEMLMLKTLRLIQPNLRIKVESILSKHDALHALIFDYLYTFVGLSVADELDVPDYLYSISSASSFSISHMELQKPTLSFLDPEEDFES